MSRKGGRNAGKDGGAHDTTHETIAESRHIDSSELLEAEYLPKSIGNSTPSSVICLQDGGVEANGEALGLLASDSEDLESYERSVIENNAEWLKSRCRNLENVDFDIPTSTHDMLDLEVKEKDIAEGLFEEMETMTADDTEDTPVIRICEDTCMLTTTSLNVPADSNIQIQPDSTDRPDTGQMAIIEQLALDSSDPAVTFDPSSDPEANKSSDEDFRLPNAILLSPQDLESLRNQGYVFDTIGEEGTAMERTKLVSLSASQSNLTTMGEDGNNIERTKMISLSGPRSNLPANTNPGVSSDAETESVKEGKESVQEHVPPSPATINLSGKILKTETGSSTVIPSSTGTFMVAQPSQSSSPDGSTQPNLTLATISISTDKIANSTQILVNTNQGQQLYLINTADLTQATNALQPLAQPQDGGVGTNVSSSVSPVPTPTQASVVGVSPLQVQGTGYFLLPVNSESSNQGMVLAMGGTNPADRAKKMWICPQEGCNKVFRKLSKLKIHQMRHTGERPFKCSKPGCDWAFTTAYKLKRHEEAHGGRKDYICDFEGCGRKFTTVYNLNSHKKLHERPFTEICPKPSCRQQFPTKRQLDIHMRTHSGVEKNYKCPHEGCNKVFFSKNCMGSHARVHLQDREELQCKFDGCGKVFDKLCRLRQHMRQHTGEKPYICQAEGCNWAFATASKLKRHSAKHTGVRKWTCNVCLKGFMRAEHLKGHMITHSGDKPFACPVEHCLAKFTAKGSLYVHLKRHEVNDKKITYHCPIGGCLSHYNTKGSLRNHILKHYLNAQGTDMNHVDLVPFLTGDDMSDSSLSNLITSSSENTSVPTSTNTSLPQLLTDTSTCNLINTADFINTAALTDSVMLAAESSSSEMRVTSPVSSSQPVTSSSSSSSTTPSSLLSSTSVINKGQKSSKLPKHTNQQAPDLPAVISRVTLENTSGSARTDYRSNHILSDRARKRWHSLRGGNAETQDIDSLHESEKMNSLVLPSLSPDFTSTELSNSQGLMFRDPETGITFVQTQLLQDDPPHPELYSDTLLDSSDSLSLPDATTSSVSLEIKPEYTGTTINLQDLE